MRRLAVGAARAVDASIGKRGYEPIVFERQHIGKYPWSGDAVSKQNFAQDDLEIVADDHELRARVGGPFLNLNESGIDFHAVHIFQQDLFADFEVTHLKAQALEAAQLVVDPCALPFAPACRARKPFDDPVQHVSDADRVIEIDKYYGLHAVSVRTDDHG